MSTIKVNKIENTATANGGIAIDASGHVTVDGQQLPTAGALSNRNLVINGAMQVSQRATSVTGVANNSDEGYQTLDRFGMYFGNSAGGVCTVSQATDVPSNQGFSNSIKIDVTTADTSVASNHEIYVGHKIESQTVRNSGWNYTSASSYVTLSFWAKSSKAGTYCVSARADDVGAKYYPFEYTLAADTWTKVTHSIPGDSSLVFNNDTGSGLDVRWVLVAGSSRQGGTNGAWGATSTSNMATSNQVNFFDSTSNDFYITGVQLEVGEKATPFEHRSFGDELAKCQRYFCKSSTYDVFPTAGTNHDTAGMFFASIVNSYTSNAAYSQVFTFPVPMRTTPGTIVTYGTQLGSTTTTGQVSIYDSSGGAWRLGTATIHSSTDKGFNLSVSGTWGAGSNLFYGAFTASSEL